MLSKPQDWQAGRSAGQESGLHVCRSGRRLGAEEDDDAPVVVYEIWNFTEVRPVHLFIAPIR